jgi:hypothetical protein
MFRKPGVKFVVLGEYIKPDPIQGESHFGQKIVEDLVGVSPHLEIIQTFQM